MFVFVSLNFRHLYSKHKELQCTLSESREKCVSKSTMYFEKCKPTKEMLNQSTSWKSNCYTNTYVVGTQKNRLKPKTYAIVFDSE